MKERSARSENTEQLTSGYSGQMFFVLTLGAATTLFGKHLLPPLLPVIIKDIGITSFEAGVALSAMSVTYAILQYPSGRFSDLLTRKTILVTSIVTSIVGFTVLFDSRFYAIFVIGTALIGAGHGLFAPASRAFLSDLFIKQRGQAFGFHMMSGDLAGMAAAGIAVLVAVTTWRIAFLPVIGLLSLSFLALHRWGRESYDLQLVPLGLRGTIGRLFTNTELRWILLAYSLYVFTIRGFVGFLPAYLQSTHGFSTTLASATFALLFVVGIIMKPIAGRISDLVARPVVGSAAILFGTIGIAILVVSSTTWVILLGVIAYAVGHKSFGPVMQAYLMDLLPEESMGGDLGAIRTVYLGIGSFGPIYVGYLAGKLNYSVAFGGFIGSFLLCGTLILWVELSHTIETF